MSESVEQAALRRADTDWQGRARREAAAILDESGVVWQGVGITSRDELLGMLAIAWLQGTIYGSHRTLSSAERAFDRLRDAL